MARKFARFHKHPAQFAVPHVCVVGPGNDYHLQRCLPGYFGEKHPHALGRSGPEVWAEIWDVVGPLAHKVMQEGTSTWAEDQILYMNRHGYTEETYFTFSYSPVFNEQGEPAGVFCACTETTEKVLSAKKLKESELFARNVIMSSEAAQIVWVGPDMVFEMVNGKMLEILGRDDSILGKPFMEAIPELKQTPCCNGCAMCSKPVKPITSPRNCLC